MSITILDESTATALATASSPQEICGPNGALLGHFIPAAPKMSYPEVGVTDDELERQFNNPGETWVTPEAVMARLREIDRCSP